MALSEIQMEIRQKEELAHKADPQNHPRRKWWVASPEVRAYFAHLNYYSAHLMLGGVQWLQSQTDAPQRLARARPAEIETTLGLPQVRANEDWLRALGMEPNDLEAVRRRAMGELGLEGGDLNSLAKGAAQTSGKTHHDGNNGKA